MLRASARRLEARVAVATLVTSLTTQARGAGQVAQRAKLATRCACTARGERLPDRMAKHIGLVYGHETELPSALLARLASSSSDSSVSRSA